MIIHMKGVPCHASQPEDGRNPAFAIAELVRSIPEFTDPAGYKGLVMCTVICIDVGEEAFGMSASEGRLLLTIRGEHDDEMDILKQKLEEKAKKQAEKYGLEYDINYRDSFFATVSHKESNDKVRKAAKELGFLLLEGDRPIRGSEDYGAFTRRTKGAFFSVGCGEKRAGIHTVEYDFNDAIIPTVVDIYIAITKG
jgi:metal-dependent amidase/aminoacylase/carboxypeptidase family protein